MKCFPLYFVFFLFFTMASLAQNPKQKSFDYFPWNYPEVATEYKKLAVLIDESPILFSVIKKPMNSKGKLISKEMGANTQISSNFIKRLDFWFYETVPYQQAELFLEVKPKASKFIITAEEKKGSGQGEAAKLSGELFFVAEIEIVIRDKNQNVLHQNIFTHKTPLHSIDGFENSHITSEDLALKLTEDYFSTNIKKLVDEANGAFASSLMYRLAENIRKTVDLRRTNGKFYVYNFKNKKGFDFKKIQKSIESLKEINDWEYSSDYQNRLARKLKPLIDFWNTEALKYNKEDKKERKVYWGLMASISGAYHALGEYEKALEVSEKLAAVDYKNSYKYLEQLPSEAINERNSFFNKSKMKVVPTTSFSGTHKPINVHYLNYSSDLLGANSVSQSAITIKNKRAKAKLLSKLLGQYSYLKELTRLSKKFNNRGGKEVGFEYTDEYYANVFSRVVDEAEDLTFNDLSFLDPEDKILVTKISKDMFEIYDIVKKELHIGELSEKRYERISQLFAEKMVLLTKIFDTEKVKQRGLERNINTLCNKLLIVENEGLLELPFLDILADELTAEGKLTFQENQKLYKQVFKRYKKTYVNNFIDKNSYMKHIHHSAKGALLDGLKNYHGIFKEDIENVGVNYKNSKNPEAVVDILSIFIK